MMRLHGWADCEPVAMDMRTGKVDDTQTVRMKAIWETLTDGEKIMFHQFTCFNRHSDQHLSVIEMIARRMEQDA